MINPIRPTCTISTAQFTEALTTITRSGAVGLINGFYAETRQPGARSATGIRYTIDAFLVAALLRLLLSQPITLAGILAVIGDFTPDQLTAVQMAGQDTTVIHTDSRREYARFHGWLSRRMVPLDPGADIPARRVVNSIRHARARARTIEQHHASKVAAERLRTVINRLVAGSIDEASPALSRGDVVVDESIYDICSPGAGLGTAPDKRHCAASMAAYYVRGVDGVTKPTTPMDYKHASFGVGLTAVSRVGEGESLHAIPVVFIGIDIHKPTSGSVDGLRNALDHARRNGLDNRRGGRAAWPTLTVDRGYNIKTNFAELMLDFQYSQIARYPKHWGLIIPTVNPPGTSERSVPGPVQMAGAFYCPAVLAITDKPRVPSMRDLLATEGFADHDDYLARILPFLMGVNSRPYRRRSKIGRPSLIEDGGQDVKIDLVCPAELGRVACPLKKHSMTLSPGTPEAEPTWAASDRRCCTNASVTVTLTGPQLKRHQWNQVPGSWSHSLRYESARALTEQQFARLKNPSVTGLAHMKYTARREPLVQLFLALAVADANISSQREFDRRRVRPESIDVRWRRLERGLGHKPTRIPPLS